MRAVESTAPFRTIERSQIGATSVEAMNKMRTIAVGDPDVAIATEALLRHSRPCGNVISAGVFGMWRLGQTHQDFSIEGCFDDGFGPLIYKPQKLATAFLHQSQSMGTWKIAPFFQKDSIRRIEEHSRIGLMENDDLPIF